MLFLLARDLPCHPHIEHRLPGPNGQCTSASLPAVQAVENRYLTTHRTHLPVTLHCAPRVRRPCFLCGHPCAKFVHTQPSIKRHYVPHASVKDPCLDTPILPLFMSESSKTCCIGTNTGRTVSQAKPWNIGWLRLPKHLAFHGGITTPQSPSPYTPRD